MTRVLEVEFSWTIGEVGDAPKVKFWVTEYSPDNTFTRFGPLPSRAVAEALVTQQRERYAKMIVAQVARLTGRNTIKRSGGDDEVRTGDGSLSREVPG